MLWAGEALPELRLAQRDGTDYVYDSRAGVSVEYPILASSRSVLDALSTPKKLVNLARELDGVDVEAAVARLTERGLVFHQGDRCLTVPPPRPFTVPVVQADFAAAAA